MTSESRLLRKPSLKHPKLSTVFAIVGTAQVLSAIVLVGFMSYRSSSTALEAMATRISDQINDRVLEHLDRYTSIPRTVTNLNHLALLDSSLPAVNLEPWERLLVRQSETFTSLSYIYFGNIQGDYVEIKIGAPRELRLSRTIDQRTKRDTPRIGLYPVTEAGLRGPLKLTRDYDPRPRPWFRTAVKSRKPTWTSIYPFTDTKTLGISFVRPLIAPNGEVQGVVGSDHTLLATQEFLKNLRLLKSGKVFILERNGNLVATSGEGNLFRDDLSRIAGTDSDDRLIQAAAQVLQQNPKKPNPANNREPEHRRFTYNSMNHYLHVVHFNDGLGLDWRVVVVIPEADFMGEVQANRRNIMWVCGLATVGAVLVSLLVAKWLSRSLTVLSTASQTIGSGNLAEPVPSLDSSWEVMTLATSLEDMRHGLKVGRDRMENYTQDLEREVADRTLDLRTRNQELTQTLQTLQTSQDQLIRSEKLAALGQLVTSISHEMNTPLGVIRSSVNNIGSFLREDLEASVAIIQRLTPNNRQILLSLFQQTVGTMGTMLSTREKRQFRQQISKTLKELAVPNPDHIADTLVDIGIYDDIQPLIDLFETDDCLQVLSTLYHVRSSQRSLQAIEAATDSAALIVQTLRSYSNPELYQSFGEIDLAESLETALILYQTLLKRGVTVDRDYHIHPKIWGCGDEVNQVWTNLIHNALQAMNYQGHLKIELTTEGDSINATSNQSTNQASNAMVAIVRLTNNGPAIDPEAQTHIYEAFFTTRSPGEGKGMGLTIVKQILAKHYGTISFVSTDSGTTFTVTLPLDFRHNPMDLDSSSPSLSNPK